MRQLAHGSWRFFLIFGALLIALPSATPVRGARSITLPSTTQAATGASVEPGALRLTLALGQRADSDLTISNSSNQPLQPAAYEAYPATAAAQARRAAPRSAGLPRQSARLDPQLLAELQTTPGRQADFTLYLRDQPDLSAAYQIADWRARGEYVFRTLRDYADQSQRGLRASLDARRLSYRSFWIVNALQVRGRFDDVQALAGHSEVALVRANHVTRLIAPQAAASAAATAANAGRCSPDNLNLPVCWNIRQIGADRVWRDFGVTGGGIVIGSMDTGVRYTQPALATQYRGYRGPGSYDHNYNWFDPKGLYRAPNDSSGHGTHTTGTMVASGDGTFDQPAVGVAPGAKWIAAQSCLGATCNESDLMASAQWMLAPTTLDGELPRPDLRPMIINNSWAGAGDDGWYAGYVAAWRAAGIFPVFAAGNTGGNCGSIGSPGDYADAVAVGATDQNDAIAAFSARGPSADGHRKPDFVAPGTYSGGVGVLSTGASADGAYLSLQGTSMATPHVSGLVALLWSANPALIGDYDATYAVLQASAHGLNDLRCGDSIGGANNVYGNGRIDAYAAIQRARVDVPWLSVDAAPGSLAPQTSATIGVHVDAAKVPGPGSYSAQVLLFGADLAQPLAAVPVVLTVTPGDRPLAVSGRVLSAATRAPVAARVGVRGGQSVATNSAGTFSLTLAPGTYELVVSAPSFFTAAQTITLAADLRLPDIALVADVPRIASTNTAFPSSIAIGQSRTITITIANSGTQPLYYSLRVPPDQFAAMRSDEPGGTPYRWVDLPADAAVLRLSGDGYAESVPLGIQFPFYGYTFTDTLVTANGLLAFSPPSIPYVGLSSGCFPDTSFLFYEIAPLRINLDPSSGGKIRFGTVDAGTTFVLSYERVPLQGAAAGATYTFQVLLHDDGRITYQYRDLAPLPAVAAVGLQRAPLEYQKIGCGSATALHDRLAIELRPQISTPQWLRVSSAGGTLLPSGQQMITATLNWTIPETRPQRGQIEIASNDPFGSPIVLPVSVDMLPAPRQYWLPFAPRASGLRPPQ